VICSTRPPSATSTQWKVPGGGTTISEPPAADPASLSIMSGRGASLSTSA
jgi:hypothetical protein